MHESLITKKIIAYSFKKAMENTTFQKISIRKIMESAEIRRQTFYDHFQDKYELLSWIYQQDMSENISDFLDYEEWQKVVFRILTYFNKNQLFYKNALAINEQNYFNHYFLAHTEMLISTISKEISKKEKLKFQKNIDYFNHLFIAHAFVSLTTEWLLSDCQTSVDIFSKQMTETLEQTIHGLLK